MGRSLGILWAEQGHEVFFRWPYCEERQRCSRRCWQGHGGTNDEAAALLKCCYTQWGVNQQRFWRRSRSWMEKFWLTAITLTFQKGCLCADCAIFSRNWQQKFQCSCCESFQHDGTGSFELAPTPLKDYGVSVFVASNDEQARQVVMTLAEEIGFVPINWWFEKFPTDWR